MPSLPCHTGKARQACERESGPNEDCPCANEAHGSLPGREDSASLLGEKWATLCLLQSHKSEQELKEDVKSGGGNAEGNIGS